MRFKFTLFLVVTSLFACDAGARQLQQPLLDYLVSRSSAIVVGVVASSENVPQGPKTIYKIEVERYLHHDPQIEVREVIHVPVRGGKTADGTRIVDNSVAYLRVGGRYLLFMQWLTLVQDVGWTSVRHLDTFLVDRKGAIMLGDGDHSELLAKVDAAIDFHSPANLFNVADVVVIGMIDESHRTTISARSEVLVERYLKGNTMAERVVVAQSDSLSHLKFVQEHAHFIEGMRVVLFLVGGSSGVWELATKKSAVLEISPADELFAQTFGGRAKRRLGTTLADLELQLGVSEGSNR